MTKHVYDVQETSMFMMFRRQSHTIMINSHYNSLAMQWSAIYDIHMTNEVKYIHSTIPDWQAVKKEAHKYKRSLFIPAGTTVILKVLQSDANQEIAMAMASINWIQINYVVILLVLGAVVNVNGK